MKIFDRDRILDIHDQIEKIEDELNELKSSLEANTAYQGAEIGFADCPECGEKATIFVDQSISLSCKHCKREYRLDQDSGVDQKDPLGKLDVVWRLTHDPDPVLPF